MVLQDGGHRLIFDRLVHPIQDQQTGHAQICNPLLQEAEIETGWEEQYLLVLELSSKVMPVWLVAVPAVEQAVMQDQNVLFCCSAKSQS